MSSLAQVLAGLYTRLISGLCDLQVFYMDNTCNIALRVKVVRLREKNSSLELI